MAEFIRFNKNAKHFYDAAILCNENGLEFFESKF